MYVCKIIIIVIIIFRRGGNVAHDSLFTTCVLLLEYLYHTVGYDV